MLGCLKDPQIIPYALCPLQVLYRPLISKKVLSESEDTRRNFRFKFIHCQFNIFSHQNIFWSELSWLSFFQAEKWDQWSMEQADVQAISKNVKDQFDNVESICWFYKMQLIPRMSFLLSSWSKKSWEEERCWEGCTVAWRQKTTTYPRPVKFCQYHYLII